ncbi:hypothetical protein DUNSADRAFT_14400 [Dunaliella salina]|uniref:SWIM-type domain-containing protein n=1 Tax=Dunaliella salina TaxID=3046 RepID=A0ABQ7G7D2_DUNSA|nr:hypothetical protein DUNSADRAFT_14400 [Dunaliella salina]|eukprot:KAF5830515.1 hypothetical protein DUNSADRAFT_14400 [Dunaliella salina]
MTLLTTEISINGRVRARIVELAQFPSLTASYIKGQAHSFAKELVANLDIDSNSTQFFPNEPAVKRIMNQAREQRRLDPQDHVAVQKFVELDQAQNPESHWYYRVGDGPNGNEPMLLVHQTAFQKEMMAKYGGTIVGMDATYKTNSWGLPLVLLVVADNHGNGYPIASAFIQREEQGQLAEFLRLLRTWNPSFNPTFFSIDKSQAEMNAIHAEFPDSRILLCDFHRQQLWQRWIASSDVPRQYKDDLLEKMRLVGYANTVTDFHVAMHNLKACPGWQKSKTIANYWDQHWGNCIELWATCHRQVFHCGMDTNNFTESMNRVLKACFLSPRPDRRLDSLLESLCKEAWPYFDAKYIEKNKSSARLDAKKHKYPVPDFLLNRPAPIRGSLQEQHELGDTCSNLVCQMSETQFTVPKSDFTLSNELNNTGLASYPGMVEAYRFMAAPYFVDMASGTCTCRQFVLTNMPCKHMFGVLRSTGKPWSSLPPSVLESPWMNIDFKVVNKSGEAPIRPIMPHPPSPTLSLPTSPRASLPSPPPEPSAASAPASAPASLPAPTPAIALAQPTTQQATQQALAGTCPNPARLSIFKELLKRLETAGVEGASLSTLT